MLGFGGYHNTPLNPPSLLPRSDLTKYGLKGHHMTARGNVPGKGTDQRKKP